MENYKNKSAFKDYVFKYSKHLYVCFVFIFCFLFLVNFYDDSKPLQVFENKSENVSIYIGSFSDIDALEDFLSNFTFWAKDKSLNLYPPPYIKVQSNNGNMIVTWGPFKYDYAEDVLSEILDRWNVLGEIKNE